MKIISLLFLSYLLLACSFTLHAEKGQTLLRIDGNEISVDEFTYYFQHSGQKQNQTPGQYFPFFLDFKLKVADAKRMQLDTLSAFRDQYEILQSALLKSILTDELRKREQRCSPDQQPTLPSSQKFVKIEEITIRLPQHSTRAEEKKAEQTIDSIYHALNQGASFSELAQKYTTCQPKQPSWQSKATLLQEVADQLTQLTKGTYSRPFYSPVGIHIVKLNDQKSNLSPEERCPILSRQILKEGTNSLPKQSTYQQWLDCTLNMQTLPFRELYESLLVSFRESLSLKTEHLSPKEEELEEYFKKHKDNYRWELPHFRGAVIHCTNKKAASKIKKLLKKIPESAWTRTLSELSRNHPELKAEIESGLFQIGKNCYIDKLAFKCGSFTVHPKLPYTFIMGKRLKKGAEKYTDVRESVEKDYIKQLRAIQTDQLKQQFHVEINQYVLKTVNCSGNI